MKKIYRLIIVIVAAAFALTACSSNTNQSPFAFEKGKLETGDLTAFVVVNGVIQPARAVEVAWKTSGQVGQMMVTTLETVTEGQKLGDIAPSSLPTSILTAALELAEAEKALNALLENDTNVYEAQLAVVTAREEVDKATKKWNGVASNSRPVADYYIDAARAELSMAETEVDRKQDAYDHTPDDPDQKAIALKMLSEAKRARDRALGNLNYLLGTPSTEEVDRAQAELDLANSKLADAEREYNRIKDGIPAEDLGAATARVHIAKVTLEQAYITAPYAGVVTSILSQPGDLVQPGVAALRIEDQSHIYINAQISEIDVNRINIGQEVEVTLDAVYGQAYHGKVVEIGTSGVNSGGVVNFPLKVELTDRDDKVRTGMTAILRIQVETVNDVLLVPNRAVRVRDGERVVYVDTGLPIPQPVVVRLGVSSETMSQVLEGDIKPGDTIILNPDVILQMEQAQ